MDRGGVRVGALRIGRFALVAIVVAGVAARAGTAHAAHESSRPGGDIVVDANVMIPMRDGVRLAADIYRPRAAGTYPVLVERTPYDRRNSSEVQAGAHRFFAERGYAVVIQDTRGRYASEGGTLTFPGGRSINIADGIVRARYRESRTGPTLIEPGRMYRYTVDLWATSNAFRAGHRLRVRVHSSNFPRWDRNLNTAESPESGARSEVAFNTVFHDGLRPSHIVLPAIPG
jgi:predicted acyl esterase